MTRWGARPAVEVVCWGETMGQFVPADGRPIEQAGSFALFHAGAESNVAVGLARLGHRAAWVGRLGDDPVGRRILAALDAEGVDTGDVRVVPDRPTGVFLKSGGADDRTVTYYRAGSAAAFMDDSDADRALDRRPRVLHLTGITPALSPGCDHAVEHALAAAGGRGIVTSFDVNYRAALWPSREAAANRLRVLADLADIVFLGADEADTLWQSSDPAAVRGLLPAPEVVVLKDAGASAVVMTREGVTVVPALAVDVLEPVGAGDAFAAGWLSGYLGGVGEARAARYGHLMARAALGSLSDQGERLSATAVAAQADDPLLWPASGSAARGRAGGAP